MPGTISRLFIKTDEDFLATECKCVEHKLIEYVMKGNILGGY